MSTTRCGGGTSLMTESLITGSLITGSLMTGLHILSIGVSSGEALALA